MDKSQENMPRVEALLLFLRGALPLAVEVAQQGLGFVGELKENILQEGVAFQRIFRELSEEVFRSYGLTVRTVRALRVGEVFSKIFFRYRLFALSAPMHGEERERKLNELHQELALYYRRQALALRGGLLKIGQFASSRMDVLPKPYLEALSDLQDRVPPLSFETVRPVVERELRAPLEEVFTSFEEQAVAAASIGQVHRAKLAGGAQVAVKVQYPGIASILLDDLAAAEQVARRVEALSGFPLQSLAAELKEHMAQELDFRKEAAVQERFREMLAGKEVIVPALYPKLCTERLLVSEWVEGERVREWLVGAKAAERAKLLHSLLDIFCRQVLQHGVFQADPHPGNILVTSEGVPVLLDFGCCKVLDASTREGFGALARAMISFDFPKALEVLEGLGFELQDVSEEEVRELSMLFLNVFTEGAKAPDRGELGRVWKKLQKGMVKKIPRDFVLLARVFALLGGLIEAYAPNVSFHQAMLPYLQEL